MGSWQIPSYLSRFSWFERNGDLVEGKLENAVVEIASHAGSYKKGTPEQQIADLYNCAMDVAGRNATGLAPLHAYFDRVDKARTVNELVDALVPLWKVTSYSLLGPEVGVDSLNADSMVVYFKPNDFFIGRDYYFDESMTSTVDAFRTFAIKMFLLYGYDREKAESAAESVLAFGRQSAAHSHTSDEWLDFDQYYNPYTYDEILKLYSNIDMRSFLKKIGFGPSDRYVVYDVENAKFINSMMTQDNLDFLKEYVKFVMIKDFASMSSDACRKAVEQFELEVSGAAESISESRQAYGWVSAMLPWQLGDLYSKRYFDKNSKAAVERYVAEIKNVYYDVIDRQDWMSDATKAKAKKKLDTMKVRIGYPDDPTKMEVPFTVTAPKDGGTLIGNVLAYSEAFVKKQMKEYKAGKRNHVDKSVWEMAPQTVNACYMASDNSINFPAAFIQYPFFDTNWSDEANYGGIGAIIAHEITHAFDSNGSQFDENGNHVVWWTDEEYAAFNERLKAVENLYDRYDFTPTRKVNGRLTVTENTADLGGMSAVCTIIKNKNLDPKEFFEHYALTWAYLSTEEADLLRHATNVHAPNKIRVNAVVSCMDLFYETYGIKPGDGMYLAPEDRAGVWK